MRHVPGREPLISPLRDNEIEAAIALWEDVGLTRPWNDPHTDIRLALGRDNLFATQFHPEKSGPVGLALLASFARWDGKPC